MLTVTYVLLIGALIAAIAEAMGKCPGWVATILLTVVVALIVLPK